MNVLKLKENVKGRDIVLGDIHGAYDMVVDSLKRISFNPQVDRLFSVGDLVDRGPQSRRALNFMKTPWVFPVRGNHEDMFLEIYENGEPTDKALEMMTSGNGMRWWMTLTKDERREFISEFKKLPIAIEIETSRGVVGLIHGEVPIGMSWADYKSELEKNNSDLISRSLWGRTRIGREDQNGVRGIGRLFVGHTPVETPKRLANVYYVDTGAVFGLLDDDVMTGRLSIIELACSTRTFDFEKEKNSESHVIVDMPIPNSPFGKYAK